MRVISVNVGKVQPIQDAKASGVTGIYKFPVPAAVRITRQGLKDDAICDTENHGGVDQAVYVFGTVDYAWWSATLGRELPPGCFGENLTVSELDSADFSIGDRLRVGSVVMEVTAPRIPCVTLAARMGDPAFVKRFRYGERPGFFCRVLQEGYVTEGDEVVCEPYQGETISVIEMFRDFYEPHLTEATLRRHLAAPIAIRARKDREKQLRELLAESDTAIINA